MSAWLPFCRCVTAVMFAAACVEGQTNLLAPTPPMGWNSWDSYGLSVTQEEFEANATYMAANLRQYGWQYAVVDEGWYLKNPDAKAGSFQFTMDQYGRFTPALNRFPSAAGGVGFGQIAAWAHGHNLRFGIHVIRGIPREAVDKNLPIAGSKFHAAEAADKSDTCAWNSDNYGVANNAAGQAYYNSIAALYASWGVDFVKIDCISSPYKANEIRMFSQALKATLRPIVLSLSPGPTPIDEIADLRKYAQMWRISGDVWDHWLQWPKQEWSQGLLAQFAMAAKWAPLVEPEHWPDADMLPLDYLGPRPGEGKARESEFTPEEARTLVTLWCIFRSPLFMGGNLTKLNDATRTLLTNREVIDVDQHSTGGRQIMNEGQKIVWAARSDRPGVGYLALFNTAGTQQPVEYPLQSLGFSSTSFTIRDLWQQKDMGTSDRVRVTLKPHASALFRVMTGK